MAKRSAFPRVFWISNSVEILERYAYYGIYAGFGIYMTHLGYSKAQLGIVQSIFLLFSYLLPIVSGTFADRYGFKKILIVSYLVYLPSIFLLIFTKSFTGIALTMLGIGFAAGIFKPLISGIVRVVTDKTNTTLGFGIYYQMINLGGTFGPIMAGRLRIISWNYAFIASAIAVSLMFVITLFFYKEPPRAIHGETLKKKFNDLGIALSDGKFLLFLFLIGIFFWLPLWSFINILAIYIDKNIDTAGLYIAIRNVLGSGFANFISDVDKQGTRHILGETISNTSYMVILFQLVVSYAGSKFKAMPAFIIGLVIGAAGFMILAFAKFYAPSLIFLGILLFAICEMATSPRVMEYITWIAPKEKAGLYMGTHYLACGLGAVLSGVTYTSLYGWYNDYLGHAEYIWYTLAAHYLFGALAIYLFTRTLGGFKEMDA